MNTPSANIKTGHTEQPAFFCSVLYKLTLFKGDAAQTIDLGFSGGRLLERLIQEPGQVIDRETLVSHAWNNRVVGPGSLNQQIYTLRKILGDEKDRQIIQTVARRGYRFNPAFVLPPQPADNHPDASVEPPVGDAPVVDVPVARRNNRRKWALGITAATVLVVNFFTTLPAQFLASRQQVGKDSVVYVESQQPLLQKLIQRTHGLSQRILDLSDKPVQLAIVGGDSGYYRIYCTPQGGESRAIRVQDDQIENVSDSQLRKCME
ncbi:winged helix-turn-helix domain-containing protein [Pseudomonas sp. PB3P13]